MNMQGASDKPKWRDILRRILAVLWKCVKPFQMGLQIQGTAKHRLWLPDQVLDQEEGKSRPGNGDSPVLTAAEPTAVAGS